MNLMKYKVWYFVISTLIILPGIVFLFLGGIKPGVDFTGGTLVEYQFSGGIDKSSLEKFGTVSQTGNNSFLIRAGVMDDRGLAEFRKNIQSQVGGFSVKREETVGPIIGDELKSRALLAIGVASLAVVGYITYAFRKVPKPASSFRFGVATIVALTHDVLVVVGVFAILGYFFNVEIDVLFVTAVLTVIGFSVHDTIVVFDRIRENLVKNIGKKFEQVADISVAQTLVRSLNTSLTVVFTLLALLLFGGGSIKYFVVALLVGIISGTYSSIFNATAFLTWWEEKRGA